MRFDSTRFWAIIWVLSAAAWGETSSLLRLNPQSFSGSRGSEPMNQVVGLVRMQYNEHPWTLSLHFEGETFGRRDVSLDIDRAYYHFSEGEFDSHYYVGRLHPYELLEHPAAQNPWGLLAANESLNYGTQLGYGFSNGEMRPTPILMGWLGGHYKTPDRERLQLAISASPVFIPSMGSEVELLRDAPVSVGRFARRPPQTLILDGTQSYPLRLELDRSRALEDIIFQPQVKVQAKIQSESFYPEVENWISLSRAPSPFPTFSTQDYLIVNENTVEAYAKVTPKFPQRFTGTETLRWNIPDAPWNAALVGSLLVHSDNRWGYELSADSDYLRLAILEEKRFGQIDTEFTSSEANYFDLMGQVDVRIPWEEWLFYGGIKSHVRQSDLWTHAGVAIPVAQRATLQTGFDIFHGAESSYFGEWRSNSRVGAALNWEIDG